MVSQEQADHLMQAFEHSEDHVRKEDWPEIHRRLAAGEIPCRFCGIEWMVGGYIHDPLRMAGVSTLQGCSRHWSRMNTVTFGRFSRFIADFMLSHPRIVWAVVIMWGIAVFGSLAFGLYSQP